MSLVLRLFYVALIIYSLISIPGLLKGERAWYRREVISISDWRNMGCFDYSTNAVVTNWYGNCKSKYFRQENIKEYRQRLLDGDTLKLGVDYYGITTASVYYFTREFTLNNFNRLDKGKLSG